MKAGDQSAECVRATLDEYAKACFEAATRALTYVIGERVEYDSTWAPSVSYPGTWPPPRHGLAFPRTEK